LQASQAKTQAKVCKRVCLPQRKRKFKIFFPALQKKIKTPDTQTNTTKTVKLNNDNGLQARTTEHQLATAVFRNGGFSGKLKCSFSNQHLWWVDSEVLRNPPLRQPSIRACLESITHKTSN